MFSKKITLSLLTCSLLTSFGSMANTLVSYHGESLKRALETSDVSVSFRGRYETSDQDDIESTADALTIKSRFSVATGRYHSFSMGLEVDNVFAVLDDYNDTFNGLTEYPVIADPENTDINLAYLKYSTSNFRVVLGRQRIKHDNQRFVGNVGWRQNEQTFDGIRTQYKNNGFEADYSYISTVNNILGEGDDGNFHLANVNFEINKTSKVSFFGYALDYEASAAQSTATIGLMYSGKFSGFIVNAAMAKQSEHADNINDYSATYLNLGLGYQFTLGELTLLGGYEVLGSDNGVSFQTPLATGHKFNGWADQFLQTPSGGLQDVYLTLTTKLFIFDFEAGYHDYVSDSNDKDMGKELNMSLGYQISKEYNALLKYASYKSGSSSFGISDADKLWLQFSATF